LTRDLLNIVIIRFLVTLLLFPAILIAAGRSVGLGVLDHARTMWRACAASAVMAGAVFSMNQVLDVIGPVRLGLDVTMGATVYLGVLLLLWNASGRPVSAECDLLVLLSRGWAALDAIRDRAPKTVR
jgi:hypothetical protein